MTRSASVVLIVIIVALLGASALADDFEDGFAASQMGDYATAFRLWRPLAEKGDGFAQSNLGWLYDKGLGVPQDDAEAVKWYRRAAEQGHAKPQCNLGVMYFNGRGVPQDDAEAVKWYRRAAEQGHAFAQYNLGAMYVNGRGVPQDYVQAHKWFNLAASRFSADFAEERTSAIESRNAVAAKMTPTQIAEAQRLAREWTPKLEQQGEK